MSVILAGQHSKAAHQAVQQGHLVATATHPSQATTAGQQLTASETRYTCQQKHCNQPLQVMYWFCVRTLQQDNNQGSSQALSLSSIRRRYAPNDGRTCIISIKEDGLGAEAQPPGQLLGFLPVASHLGRPLAGSYPANICSNSGLPEACMTEI